MLSPDYCVCWTVSVLLQHTNQSKSTKEKEKITSLLQYIVVDRVSSIVKFKRGCFEGEHLNLINCIDSGLR